MKFLFVSLLVALVMFSEFSLAYHMGTYNRGEYRPFRGECSYLNGYSSFQVELITSGYGSTSWVADKKDGIHINTFGPKCES